MNDSVKTNSLPPRSRLLMNLEDTALVVIDVQERLLPHIDGAEDVVKNIQQLIAAAKVLGLSVRATEQYPRGLGSTVEEVLECIRDCDGHRVDEKIMFSCRECESLFSELSDSGISKLLLVGIETHVCIAQTALDLMASGFEIYIAVDAVGARKPIDHHVGLRRLEASGCTLTTTEAAMFEWCVEAGSEKFKQISKLVK